MTRNGSGLFRFGMMVFATAAFLAAGFDFNDADFGSAFANDHRVERVSLGYAP